MLKYQEYGSKAFVSENRGRHSKWKPKAIKLDDMSLEEQVEHLKMEVEILKKVKALQKD